MLLTQSIMAWNLNFTIPKQENIYLINISQEIHIRYYIVIHMTLVTEMRARLALESC